MDVVDLPYTAEYARSGRSACRGCKSTIEKDSLRLGVMVQSPMFDSKTPRWYHFKCFFNKQKPKSVSDIEHFESLRIEDQKKIEEKVNAGASIIVPDKKGKGVKRDASAIKAKKEALKDFRIEYAKSGRALCRGCEQKILKDEVRISKKDYDTEIGMKYGGQDMWHHLSCFAKLRSELGYFESADKLPGFKTLRKEDQKDALTQLPAIKQEVIPKKKPKIEDEVDGKLDDKEKKEYEKQVKLMFKYRDYLKTHFTKKDYIAMLEKNNQEVPSGEESMLDHLGDIMTFGALLPCEECKGQLVFKKQGYVCAGNITEWTKCNNIIKEPKRTKFVVPKHLKEKDDFLAKYKYQPRTRIIKVAHFSSNVKNVKKEEEENDKPKVERKLPPLYEMEFVILGRPKRGRELLKNQIQKLGGKVTTKINEKVMAVFASQEDVEKMNSRMSEAKEHHIHVIPEEFVDEIKENKDVPELIEKRSLCDWGEDPKKRLPPEPSTSKSKSKSVYTSAVPSKIKLTVKGGGAVDPDSGLADVAHVYENKNTKEKYNVVLSKTDIQRGLNSYYKLQLLKSDKGDKYWVFRSWGRIGTTIGDNKLERFHTLEEAKQAFENIYEEKTGNFWEMRHNFVKVPGKYYPLDVECGSDNNDNMNIDDTPSSLPKPVQNLIRLIFDINSMKNAMLEFELDTEKMPLGKLSKKHLQEAYKILNESLDLLNTGASQAKLIDVTNRFYTFVPHSFGIENPPLLNDQETIKKKLDMLDSLMEIEIAYNLMKTSGSEHSVDSYYKQLNAEIDVITPDCEEYKIIEEYVKNTHAETHRAYELELVDVFKVNRQGEDKRFKPFKKLHNHKILWHGSRTTNFAGILSQGLRIAPPEAPVTGYMFGKGIYFADMVSKSANYCCTSVQNPTGLLLLSRVALGNMYEKTEAECIKKLPKGMHSTFGRGTTQPDPNYTKEIDGAVVPLGKPVKANIKSSLLYNEFIVYDVAQVKTQYLLRVNFKYKY